MAAQNEPNLAMFTTLTSLKTEEWWNNKSIMLQHIIRADILFLLRNSQNIRAYYMLNHRIRCIKYARS